MMSGMRTTAPNSKAVGSRLADLLYASALLQQDMAAQLGISRTALNDRLKGRARFTAEELPAIASLLGMTLAELAAAIEADQ